MKLILPAVMCLGVAMAAGPVVTKVEPPDWVAGPGTSLRILVTGTNLAGASVSAALRTSAVTVSGGGTHLFVNLELRPGTRPGRYPLTIHTAEGTVQAPFDVVAPLEPQGRFQGFSSDDVIYLIMPDRFANGDPSNDDPPSSRGLHDRANARYYHGGDFQGIIQHLPYLKSLGITALWLTPIYDNADRLTRPRGAGGEGFTDYHGYGAVDYYAVEEHFGTLDKFRELVDKAHSFGIKVIQDQVANHTGPTHPWVHDPPTATWLNGSEAQHLSNTWRIWTLMDPHSNAQMRQSTLEGWFAGILPDLNQNDPEVARYLIQNTLWWIGRTGIDGIRQDTLPYVPRQFWQEWTAAIKRAYPAFRVVGEVFDTDPGLVSFFQGGKPRFDGIDSGVDALFDFPLQAAVFKVFSGAAPVRELAQVLAHDSLYVDADRLVTFLGLHDQARFMNAPNATFGRLERAFAFLMTARGTPMIYYGDEIGMRGGNDPDNRRDFPGGWKEDSHNAFEAEGRSTDEEKLFGQLQRLTRLRAGSDALRHGRMVELLAEDHAYAFARVAGETRMVVVFNNAQQPATLHIPLANSGVAEGTMLADYFGAAPAALAHNGAIDVRLTRETVAIYR